MQPRTGRLIGTVLLIGVVYAISARVGAALGGAALFDEPITLPMMAGIAVIAVGVTILASNHTAPNTRSGPLRGADVRAPLRSQEL